MSGATDRTGNGSQRASGGIGAVLREERERQGLTYEDLSETTKLRRHILETIEEEDWSNLPPPVFLKGFIRSYAKALRLDEKTAVELYESASATTPVFPLPAARRPASDRRGLYLLLILTVTVAAAGILFWSGYRVVGSNNPVTPVEPPTATVSDAGEPISSRSPSRRYPVGPPPTGMPEEERITASVPEDITSIAEQYGPEENPPVLQDGSETAIQMGALDLRAYIKARTWLKIIIDRQDPREYIFEPGSSPQWKAKEGFSLVIGNAGGIDLFYNGERVAFPGKPAEVVRLKIPEDLGNR